MQPIADWLEKLGMSEYAQIFAENRIDFSVLRDLTDQDLKDLGIVLGDRRKMLRAIRELDAASLVAPATSSKTGLSRKCCAPARTSSPSLSTHSVMLHQTETSDAMSARCRRHHQLLVAV
jgi:hypothetical protein